MLSTVASPTFPTLLDAASSTVATPHTIGSAGLIVASGTPFGVLAGGATLRITALRASDSARVHYSCTAIVGNTLTVAVTDGYTDLALAVGDAVYVTASAETFNDLFAAILATDVAVNSHATTAAPLASPALTGTPTAPTPSSGDSSTLIATTAFVKAQSYQTSGQVITYVAGLGLGTASTHASTDFATASQGVLAASALQPAGNGSSLTGLTESQVGGLTSALAALATNSLVVHLAGVETITGAKIFTAMPSVTPVALTPGGSVAWNLTTQGTATLAVPAGAFTLATPTGLVAGTSGFLRFTQPGSGTLGVITYGTGYVFGGGARPALTATAGAKDTLHWISPDGSTVECTLNQGVA